MSAISLSLVSWLHLLTVDTYRFHAVNGKHTLLLNYSVGKLDECVFHAKILLANCRARSQWRVSPWHIRKTVRNYSMLIEFWQVGLTLPSSCIRPSYSALCTSRLSSRPPRQNPPEEWRKNRPVHLCKCHRTSSFRLTVSLYNLTILHSTLYLWGLCVKNQLLCVISLSLVNTVQRCIILILVYKLV